MNKLFYYYLLEFESIESHCLEYKTSDSSKCKTCDIDYEIYNSQ